MQPARRWLCSTQSWEILWRKSLGSSASQGKVPLIFTSAPVEVTAIQVCIYCARSPEIKFFSHMHARISCLCHERHSKLLNFLYSRNAILELSRGIRAHVDALIRLVSSISKKQLFVVGTSFGPSWTFIFNPQLTLCFLFWCSALWLELQRHPWPLGLLTAFPDTSSSSARTRWVVAGLTLGHGGTLWQRCGWAIDCVWHCMAP